MSLSPHETAYRGEPYPDSEPGDFDPPPTGDQIRVSINRRRGDRTNHHYMCVDAEGVIDCVCGYGNPGDPIPTPRPKEIG